MVEKCNFKCSPLASFMQLTNIDHVVQIKLQKRKVNKPQNNYGVQFDTCRGLLALIHAVHSRS